MTSLALGDLSQHFQTLRQTNSTKQKLQTLSTEMTTGQKLDLASHLNGDVGRLISLDREIGLISEYSQSAREASQTLSLMQSSLESIETLRSNQANQVLAINESTSRPIIESATKASLDTFVEMTQILNRRSGDRSLFAGVQTDGAALENAEVMIADLVSTIPAGATVSEIKSSVDFWFDDPAGGLSTMGYTGSSTIVERNVSQNQRISLVATAESAGITDVLKATAIGAVANQLRSELSHPEFAELAQLSGVELIASATSLNALRGQMGISESFAAERMAEQEAQLTSLGIMRNDMTAADPYETAVRLQEVQLQLETQFAITARLSSLSLANYI